MRPLEIKIEAKYVKNVKCLKNNNKNNKNNKNNNNNNNLQYKLLDRDAHGKKVSLWKANTDLNLNLTCIHLKAL